MMFNQQMDTRGSVLIPYYTHTNGMFEALEIFGVHLYASDKLTFPIEARDGDLNLTKHPRRTER